MGKVYDSFFLQFNHQIFIESTMGQELAIQRLHCNCHSEDLCLVG